VNASTSRFDCMIATHFAMQNAPMSTRIRAGFVSPLPSGEQEWLPLLSVGNAGERCDGVVQTRPGQAGHVVFGPYRHLLPGHYRVRVAMEATSLLPPSDNDGADGDDPLAVIDIASAIGTICLARCSLRPEDLGERHHTLSFSVSEPMALGPEAVVEIRVWTNGLITASIASVTVERLAGENAALSPAAGTEFHSTTAVGGSALPVGIQYWLPLLSIGEAGEQLDTVVRTKTGRKGVCRLWSLRPSVAWPILRSRSDRDRGTAALGENRVGDC
jgi:hypothetical protein